MRSQEAADSAGKRAENHKDDAEACNKAEGSSQCLAYAALSAACEVGNVDGQHGKETW